MTILTGWKEIAKHLRCGVRTAQRWETVGLPVHRLKGNGTIIAFTEELDAWATAGPMKFLDQIAVLNRKVEALEREISYLKKELAESRSLRPSTKALSANLTTTARLEESER